MFKNLKNHNLIIISTVFVFTLLSEISAQSPQITKPMPQTSAEDYTWWYATLLILFLGLAGAVLWTLKSRKTVAEDKTDDKKNKESSSNDQKFDDDSVDADKELEWFRRHKKAVGKQESPKKMFPKKLPQTSKILKRNGLAKEETDSFEFTAEEFKEKLEKLHYSQLPIANIKQLEPAQPFPQLSISNDDALMSAIEQTHDEYEEDEQVRELAVRILARFKTRNSVEALSQVALYDLSSNLRSKAVSVLADFDHESVFEAMLLCCADPTREVRAAAARGLFRLNFNRADAWTRIAETNDEFRMRQAARAALEADLVTRSFDRLVHQDVKVAYEAFTLLALMIKADETKEVFEIVQNHREEHVKIAFLQVIKIVRDERVLPRLEEMGQTTNLSKDLKNKIDQTIESFALVAA
jgi:hypothetical protein